MAYAKMASTVNAEKKDEGHDVDGKSSKLNSMMAMGGEQLHASAAA